MFWHSAASNSAIDNLLDEPNVNLTTILDQDEVLMEIRGMNKKLIEFLTRPANIKEMLDLITTVPSADIPIPLQYKFPNIACEVLTSDIAFVEKICAVPLHMQILFYFFREAEPPLNPLLASYVCRVLGEMVSRKLDQNWYSYQLNVIQVVGYLQAEPDIVDYLIKHLDTSSVCDFVHKLVMNVEGQDLRSGLFEYLEVQGHLFAKITNSMGRHHTKDTHMNVCRLVSDLLFALQDETSSSTMDSDPFLLALKNQAIFERLLDVIFGDDTLSQSTIVYGLDMVLAMIGIAKKPTKPNSKTDTTYDSNENVILPTPVRHLLLSKLATLLRFLESPPSTRQPIHLPNGVLNQPLGMERLAIVKFVAHIITLHDFDLNEALIQTGILGKVLDLFWEFPWNNFLHHYVCQIVIQITKITRSNNCAKFLIVDYAFLKKIIEAFENQDLKAGYMGHLAKMAMVIRYSAEESETMDSVTSKSEGYMDFVEFMSSKWKDYNNKSTQLLAGAPLPSSGVTMSTNNQNYESDPGVTWDSSSGAGLNTDGDNADNDNFFEASSDSTFGGVDRYDDEKSKAIFEMFCFERSNSGEEEEEGDASFGRNEDDGGISIPFQSEQSEDADDGFEWRNPNIFFKQLEENEEMFGQLALNGGLGETSDDNISASSFIANPWADQEPVQVDNTDPWAAFDMANDAIKSDDADAENNGATNEDGNWANFDQSFPSTSNDNFADFSSAVDLFPSSEPPMLTTNTTPANTSNPSESSPTEETKPNQL